MRTQLPEAMRQKSFTKESASLCGKLAWEARKKREEEGRLAILALKAMPLSAPTVRALRLAKQMDSIELMMEGEKDAKELANLTAAHARLFDAWCILTGTQLPSKAKISRRSVAAPIAPLPDPVVPSDKPCPTPVAEPIQPTGPRSEDCTG